MGRGPEQALSARAIQAGVPRQQRVAGPGAQGETEVRPTRGQRLIVMRLLVETTRMNSRMVVLVDGLCVV